MAANNDFRYFAAWSALLALVSLMSPILPTGSVLTLVAGTAWIVVVSMALARFGRRGLWLLMGAPVALAQPFILGFFMWGCWRGDCI
jgi:hypothetical protein